LHNVPGWQIAHHKIKGKKTGGNPLIKPDKLLAVGNTMKRKVKMELFEPVLKEMFTQGKLSFLNGEGNINGK